MQITSENLDNYFSSLLCLQLKSENKISTSEKSNNGIYLTNKNTIIDLILCNTPDDERFFDKTFLEPACGQGIFIVKLILKAYSISPKLNNITEFIENKIFFADIDPKMIDITKKQINSLFIYLFKQKYTGNFNQFILDFTILEDIFTPNEKNISKLYNSLDYVLGNPPYISLYGRRDKKKNEAQRIYYLENYSQFPSSLKNGKINYVMLFIERSLNLLKKGGILSFIIDVAFFETAYKYCRKYLVENYKIISLTFNIKEFNNVTSGQLILTISNENNCNNLIKITDNATKKSTYINQEKWNTPNDEYKFRISFCGKSDDIIKKVYSKNDPTLKELYPKKNLRTCVMLLNMEKKFTNVNKSNTIASYPYYRGSTGLKYKYSKLNHLSYFMYDKRLQNSINDKLKAELTIKGIKNKKRIGLGEKEIYDNPKVYIRQSAKELVASFEYKPSSANNSLYVFSLRDNSMESVGFLKYLCGLLNSMLYTFFAQQRRIIRYNKGKQPQIKVSDLYQIPIPQDENLKKEIIFFVNKIYDNPQNNSKYINEIDKLLYCYYSLKKDEVKTISGSIESFQQ